MYRKHRGFTESELRRLLKKLSLTSEIDNVAKDDHSKYELSSKVNNKANPALRCSYMKFIKQQ